MFTTESEKRDYALKPMNCPGHILIFKQGIKSYRDLPLRYGEFGNCHRNEPSGGLHGIMRVRASRRTMATSSVPKTRSRPNVWPSPRCCRRCTRISALPTSSTRWPRARSKRIGSDESWDKAEQHALAEGLRASGCEFEMSPARAPSTAPRSNTR
jgi:threonyl-tRNA synthetase